MRGEQMSDRVSNVQIEDVLASIRKLVSEEVHAQSEEGVATPRRDAAEDDAPAPMIEDAPQDAPVEKLILSPHLRVREADLSMEEGAPSPVTTPDDVPDAAEGDDAPGEWSSRAEYGFRESQAAFDRADDRDDDQNDDAAWSPEAGVADWADVIGPDDPEAAPGEASDNLETDIDALLRSLPAQQQETGRAGPVADLGGLGDGADEALMAARSFPAEQEPGTEDDSGRDDAFREDELDAVLSRMQFDPEPEPWSSADDGPEEAHEPEAQDRAPPLRLERVVANDDAAEQDAPQAAGSSFERLFQRFDKRPWDMQAEAGTPPQDAPGDDGPVAAGYPHDTPHDDEIPYPAPTSEEDGWYEPEQEQGLSAALDEEMLREMVAQIVREELQGALGDRITRNVRKLVRREIQLALQEPDGD